MKIPRNIFIVIPGLLVVAAWACSFRPKLNKQKEVVEKYKNFQWTSDKFSDTSNKKTYTYLNTASINISSQGSDAWWSIFNDPVLDSLESLALQENLDIQFSIARIHETRSMVHLAMADLFPSIILQPGVVKQELSSNRPNPFAVGTGTLPRTTISTFQIPLNFNYEIDLWGKYRSNVQSARANFMASEEDMKALRLSVSGDVASNYFLIRIADIQMDLLEKAVETRRQNLKLTEERFRAGLISQLDIAQAETDLQTLQSQFYDLRISRQRVEHALAVLCGASSSGFSISGKNYSLLLPEIPPGVPSDLLKRRPDILRQELVMEATNASIGIYAASRFPSLVLTGSGGTLSKSFSTLPDYQSRTWTLGMGIAIPVFQGRRISANIQAAKARYEQAIATYEKQILIAFQEVEDVLSNLTQKKEQAILQESIIKIATETAELSRERYSKGLITYFEVLNNERAALS
ncbi:MAG TPA: efflux transporter outer membrane subunit, partial [Cytophagaceae bacterium]|nr:efflux transporter outer membrane subunit [Cytophagaceae bacterium]